MTKPYSSEVLAKNSAERWGQIFIHPSRFIEQKNMLPCNHACMPPILFEWNMHAFRNLSTACTPWNITRPMSHTHNKLGFKLLGEYNFYPVVKVPTRKRYLTGLYFTVICSGLVFLTFTCLRMVLLRGVHPMHERNEAEIFIIAILEGK